MARLINQTFKEDGWKRIICRNDGRIIGETHLGEKNTRIVRCKECKNTQVIAPPRLGIMNGKKGAFWCEPNNSCFTAFDY